MMWRLALDMGTNSLGWAAFALSHSGEVGELMLSGVRIFSDGRESSSKDRVGDSLAVERRLARGARRNRDRRLKRKNQVITRLVSLGLMPEDQAQRKALEILDPYKLRAAAVDCPLKPHELGRALFHFGQRRGFLSNRKSDSDDEESGKIKPKISELREQLGERTLGQWLYDRLKSGKSVRFRGEDGDLYADRAMYSDEFDKIRTMQEAHHSLSPADWDDLRNGNKAEGFDGIFFQRKLKPVERGRCEFFIDEYRAHKDLPVAHEFRILQEVGNLQYYDNQDKHKLGDSQRAILIKALHHQKTLTFGGILKLRNPDGSWLFPRTCRFNLENGPRDKLNGNATAVEMRKPDMLGSMWDDLAPDQQNDMLERLHDAEDDETLIKELKAEFSFTEDQARAVGKFKLVAATTHLSRKFMMRCAAIMRDENLGYDEAVREVYDDDGVYFHHSRYDVDQLLDRLPYYGELLKGSVIGGKPAEFDAEKNPEQYYGKINNPTVHVALNQLRKLINRLSDRFGMPTEIHVELVRDLKKTAYARDKIAKQNKQFAKDNNRRADIFREQFPEQNPSGLDLKKIRLWEELGSGHQLTRPCPFSGKPISAAMLFNGEAEIEHILPFSRTLDNGTANLTVAIRQANRLKGNRTPYEAFATDHHTDQGMIWREISERAKGFPENKRWRFDSDAMDRFEKEGGFLARQLTDNAYISKLTKRYLSHICDQNKIATIPGGLTAMMRGKWHLNSLLGDHNYKERNDHRHHAIDAFVVGLTDRAMLKRVSDLTKRGADAIVHIELPDITPLIAQLKDRLAKMIISYKPDHGVNGKMYKETAYGIVPDDKQDTDLKGYTLVTRKKLISLTDKEIKAIRNPGWRGLVEQHVYVAKAVGIKLDKALGDFGKEHNIKTMRILVSNQSATIIPSAPYKAYAPDSYVCVDIWQLPKGKPGKWKHGEFDWKGAFWSYADCKGEIPDKNDGKIDDLPIHPAAKFITRLFKNDMIELEEGGQVKIMRVGGFSTTNNKIDLRPQFATDGKQQYISINVLKKLFKRKLHITEDGSRKG